jgi:hypothetical protein
MHDPKIIAVVVVVVLFLVGITIWVITQRQRKAALRKRFGPEYDRVMRERGSERAAQSALQEREKRIEKYHIRELNAAEWPEYAERWRVVQSHFVDDPRGAVIDADDTVIALMRTRGYPLDMVDFEQRAADLSVDHPHVVDNYRKAHEIALRHRQGQASTEDLRQAMIYYRSLFEDLLNGYKSGAIREVA